MIWLIGNKGMLGNDVEKLLKERGLTYWATDKEVDIGDYKALEKFGKDKKIKWVINCSGYTKVDKAEEEIDEAFRINTDGVRNIALFSVKRQIRLIHISTDYVFDGRQEEEGGVVAYREDDKTNPISIYGKSKLAGEEEIKKILEKYFIIRTAWLYGATGNNFLKTMLRLTLQNPGKEFKVVNDQYGSPTWSHTLARQIRAVADAKTTGVFHSTSEGYCTWYGLACAFLEELGVEHNFVPCGTDEFPTPTKRPVNSILENARLKELGINLFSSWKEELACFVSQNRDALLDET